jgi:hypothetical protein
VEDCTIEEAAEILAKAEKIKKDPVMVKAAQDYLASKAKSIGSIAQLRDMNAKGLTKKDLMTEEDKAALQSKIETDDKIEEMGFTVKDKVELEDDEEEESDD